MFRRIEAIASDNETRARLLRWFWFLSLVVMLIGFGIIAWRAVGPR